MENWTSKKCTEIVYDTNRDGYPKDNTNTFEMKVKNRSNLIFIVEDTNGNKFGGYLNATLTNVQAWTTDSNAFVFTLKSPGRNLGMRKFNIKSDKTNNAFYLWNHSDSYLFQFGGEFYIYKENNKTSCYCGQNYFDYQGLSYPFTGNSNNFTPQRITVIQMK